MQSLIKTIIRLELIGFGNNCHHTVTIACYAEFEYHAISIIYSTGGFAGIVCASRHVPAFRVNGGKPLS